MTNTVKRNNINKFLLSSITIAILSGCGGSSSSDSNNAATETPVTTEIVGTFPAQIDAPSVSVVNDNGSLILAETGLSLYTFDNDTIGVSNCNGIPEDTSTCAGLWPPLLAEDGAIATENLTMITRLDGSEQWAYKGQALYHWHLDNAEGDIAGDGINNVWHLSRPTPLKTVELNDVNTYVGNQTIASVTESSDVLTAIRSDKDGFTLYTFDNDPINDSACAGNCINIWPPLLADPGALAMTPLSIITASNGNSQWAYKGKPLYLFVNDEVSGDINGEELNNVWHVASQTPAIQRTTENGRYLSATGQVNVLSPVGDSTTEFAITSMDKDGFNLYTFDNDDEGVSNCEGTCLMNWPAFVPSENDVAVQDFTTIERSDGTNQWAYKGQPVYFFNNDEARGDVNGSEIGGVWHLIQPTITTTFIEESNDLGSVVTIEGDVHVMLRDEDSGEFIDNIVDKSNFALYTFDNDTAGVSNCLDGCLDAWPPLLADDSDVAEAPYTIITRDDNGMKQWAINDMPLYFYTPDTTEADTLGENAGTVWHIARPAPLKVDEHDIEGRLFVGHGNVLAGQGRTAEELIGHTLYTFNNDVQGAEVSNCFGNCAVTWPPLYAVDETQAYGYYTIINRSESDGIETLQWAYKGLPLYFFSGDVEFDDTNGSNATWTIARP